MSTTTVLSVMFLAGALTGCGSFLRGLALPHREAR
ncbi:MAG: hypothetical protein JWN88_2516 [Frankiales bacterium]|nr:hypothetical protein [Frankiales bacterium]